MCRLFDLHQDRDQRWRWYGLSPVSSDMLVSRRSYETRPEAQLALTCFLQMMS